MTEAVKEVLAQVDQDIEEINAGLRKRQEQIESLQKEISELRQDREDAVRTRAYLSLKTGDEVQPPNEGEERKTAGPYVGKSITEGAELFLASVGKPPRETKEVAEALIEGGLKSEAKNLNATVFGSLRRHSKKEDSRLVKVGAKWALREWYPDGVPESDDDSKTGADQDAPKTTEKGGEDAESVMF